MDEDATWYGSIDLRTGHIVLYGFPALRERGTAPPLLLGHVYCGHGRPSQLLLSSCIDLRKNRTILNVSNGIEKTTMLIKMRQKFFLPFMREFIHACYVVGICAAFWTKREAVMERTSSGHQ